MAAPNPKKQKVARAQLDALFAESKNVWVSHYSCESFYDRAEGRSPRITSIALRRLDNAQTISFSIHQMAEKKGIAFSDISGHYDALEKEMLDGYMAQIGSHRGMNYVHWNMRDINYGFAAIEHRYQVLGGAPYIIPDEHKFDLARLLIDIYGTGYIGHPRLEKLLEKNKIRPLNFMTGAQEAEAFEAKNFVALHQSTLRKVDVIANIANRVFDRSLNTNTTWWEMHGGSIRSALNWVAENRWFQLAAGLASIAGLLLFFFWPAPS